MRTRKNPAVRPARRQVTFAWPVMAAAVLFALTGVRWPRAAYTPVQTRAPGPTPPPMAFVEIPPGATFFLWPRDFSQGHLDAWPRVMEMDAPPPSPLPPLPFREWPADEPLAEEAPAE